MLHKFIYYYGAQIMKYFILIIFTIFSNFSYATDSSILCNASFLESITSPNLLNVVSNIRETRQPKTFVQRLVFSNRSALIRSALRQVCDETTGDNPMHLAARVATDFSVVYTLIEEERGHTPHPQSYADGVIVRTNTLGETPFDILRSRFIENLPEEQNVKNLDALLELYFNHETVVQNPLKRR